MLRLETANYVVGKADLLKLDRYLLTIHGQRVV
jgi:hypothetical protein